MPARRAGDASFKQLEIGVAKIQMDTSVCERPAANGNVCKPPAEQELTSRDLFEICTEDNLRLGLLICYVMLLYIMLCCVMT